MHDCARRVVGFVHDFGDGARLCTLCRLCTSRFRLCACCARLDDCVLGFVRAYAQLSTTRLCTNDGARRALGFVRACARLCTTVHDCARQCKSRFRFVCALVHACARLGDARQGTTAHVAYFRLCERLCTTVHNCARLYTSRFRLCDRLCTLARDCER